MKAVTAQVPLDSEVCDPAPAENYVESFEKVVNMMDICGDEEALKHQAAKVYCSTSKGQNHV